MLVCARRVQSCQAPCRSSHAQLYMYTVEPFRVEAAFPSAFWYFWLHWGHMLENWNRRIPNPAFNVILLQPYNHNSVSKRPWQSFAATDACCLRGFETFQRRDTEKTWGWQSTPSFCITSSIVNMICTKSKYLQTVEGKGFRSTAASVVPHCLSVLLWHPLVLRVCETGGESYEDVGYFYIQIIYPYKKVRLASSPPSV